MFELDPLLYEIAHRRYRVCSNCEFRNTCDNKNYSGDCCSKHQYYTMDGDKPACDKSKYASCEACKKEWDEVWDKPPCANHPYSWVGTDESGWHWISVHRIRGYIKDIIRKVNRHNLLELDIDFGPESDVHTVYAMPIRITHTHNTGFYVLVQLIGGDQFFGQLMIDNRYSDAEILLSKGGDLYYDE